MQDSQLQSMHMPCALLSCGTGEYPRYLCIELATKIPAYVR